MLNFKPCCDAGIRFIDEPKAAAKATVADPAPQAVVASKPRREFPVTTTAFFAVVLGGLAAWASGIGMPY